MEVALGKNMAKEEGILERANLVVRSSPFCLVLEREDGPVAGGVAGGEDCGELALTDNLIARRQRRCLHVLRSRNKGHAGGDRRQQ